MPNRTATEGPRNPLNTVLPCAITSWTQICFLIAWGSPSPAAIHPELTWAVSEPPLTSCRAPCLQVSGDQWERINDLISGQFNSWVPPEWPGPHVIERNYSCFFVISGTKNALQLPIGKQGSKLPRSMLLDSKSSLPLFLWSSSRGQVLVPWLWCFHMQLVFYADFCGRHSLF